MRIELLIIRKIFWFGITKDSTNMLMFLFYNPLLQSFCDNFHEKEIKKPTSKSWP